MGQAVVRKKDSKSKVRLYTMLAAALVALVFVLFSRNGPIQPVNDPSTLPLRLQQLEARDGSDGPSNTQAIRARARAAVLGAFVADAAAMPLHWIYSSEEIEQKVNGRDPAFLDPPHSPFYQYPTGQLSPFGFEALTVLRSVVNRGGVMGEELMQDLVEAFEGTQDYKNGASRKLVAAVRSGQSFPEAAPRDNQLHSLVKVPIVVARYAGQPELNQKVLEATRSHQRSSEAEQYALLMASLLEKAILGMQDAKDAVEALETALAAAEDSSDGESERLLRPLRSAVDELKSLRTANQHDKSQAVQRFGPSCHLPGALLSSFALLAQSASYADAVRGDILAGGDSAGRSHCIGALTAAQQGEQAIPEAWKAKFSHLRTVEEFVEDLLQQRFGPL